MKEAKKGDTVKVHYQGKSKDGELFDKSDEKNPFKFTIGEGRVIPGFEEAVLGMSPGESKKIEVPPNKAYGPYRADLVIKVNKDSLSNELELEKGRQFKINSGPKEGMVLTLTDMDEESVTFDGNHPLAGKDLVFDIEMVDVL